MGIQPDLALVTVLVSAAVFLLLIILFILTARSK